MGKEKTRTCSYITVVRRGYDIFKLFSIKDVNCNKVTFSMAMLASLRRRNFYNLIGVVRTLQ